ncbi:MAG: cytochrome P450 [Gammaproteobacteria bacterium]
MKPEEIPLADISFTSTDVLACPFQAYRILRESDPVHLDPISGNRVLTRYDDIKQVIGDPATFSNATNRLGITRDSPVSAQIEQMFAEQGYPRVATAIDNDPPEHGKMRGLFDFAFRAPRVAAMKDRIDATVREVLDALDGRTAAEVMADIAVPVPTRIIADQLGLPRERTADFKRWSDAVIFSSDPRVPDAQMLEYARQTIEMQRYIAEAARVAQANPRDDVVSDVANAKIDGRPATMREIVWTLQNVLIAGNESTASAIGSAFRLMIEQGAEPALRAAPESIPQFVEEVLRVAAPLQSFYRRATADAQAGGCPVPAESILELRYGAANLDPRKFPEPDRVDLARRNSREHLGFGFGIHYCPGNVLARTELVSVLRQALERFRNFRLAPGADAYEPLVHLFVCGPAKLRVAFDRA